MSYVVIAYPKINEADYDRIQTIRQEYDVRQFNMVKPHITFIFSTQKLSLEALIKHVRKKLSEAKAFDVKLDSAKVVEDDSKTYSHTFFIPSIGFEEVNNLHDLLYRDELESELRADIPFIPHLDIGNNEDPKVMDDLAAKLNAEKLTIEGRVNELTVAEFDGIQVVDIVRIPLA